MRRFEKQNTGVTRRQFIAASSAVAGGLLVGFRVAAEGQAAAPLTNPFDAYLRIGADGRVTVLCAHMEGGQGILAGVATLVAEELDADWSQVDCDAVTGDPALYGNLQMGGAFQLTGGSTAMASSWHRYREPGAVARQLLVAAAAEAWGVPAGEIRVEKGRLAHASGREAGFGELVARAATLTPPASVALKSPEDWTLIGNENLRRPDTPAKTRGLQDYTIDVQLPGMLTAVLARPPRFGAQAASFNAASVLDRPGVVDVVETPRGIAVVAKTYWQALQAREHLEVEWDESTAETRGSDELLAEYRRAAEGTGTPVHAHGDAAAALANAAVTVEAEFEFPYLAHAAMEPLNAVALMGDGELDIWAGHQMPDYYQHVAAQMTGLPPTNVRLHVMMTGGFFGRRATPDADVIVEAVAVAKALGPGRPVRVQWSREDDMTGGRYRPAYLHRVRAGVDADGAVSGWNHHIVGQSIMAGTPFESAMIADGIDVTSVEGVDDMPYAVRDLSVSLTSPAVGVPVLWWRSVGHTHTAFAVETVIDDLARAAGEDPVAFRRGLLAEHPRHLGVLELAVEKAGWSEPLTAGRGRGVAVHRSFGTYVAEVAEVAVRDGEWRVERVVCAVDCGVAVNPDVIRAQMEGSIGFALAAIRHGAITLKEGRVQQDNYDSFPVLRMDEMPEVEVHIVRSAEAPTGVGEPGVPPLGPAVANAILAATGKRLRRLPFGTRV